MSRSTRLRTAVACVAAMGLLLPWAAQAEPPGDVVPLLRNVIVDPQPLCSAKDHPEPGLQGDVPKAAQASGDAKKGYNCGLSLVGHAVLDGAGSLDGQKRTPTGNANMAWAGHCAYVSGDGVAVVDVTDPANPRHVRTLRGPGADGTLETLHAVTTPTRSILVTGKYGIGTPSPNMPMSVWDVRDCANPKLLQTVIWPENIHNLTISANGRYVFATQPLQAVDLDPLFDDDPKTQATYLGDLSDVIPFALVPVEPGPDLDDAIPQPVREARPGSYATNTHEAWPSADGTTLYLGGVTTIGEVFTIVDIAQWLRRDAAGKPMGMPRIISQNSGRGHSVRTGTVRSDTGTRRIALHSEESVFGGAKGCLPEKTAPFAGPAEPFLTDITDETRPKRLSHFGLEINKAENCPAQLDSRVDASSHYHDFDSESDTRFAMVSMWNAGLRVFDVRKPEHPVEVAYFNPADVGAGAVKLDKAWGHVRYVPETRQIWLGTESGGFWVLELSPQVRKHLQLNKATSAASPAAAVRYPQGRPGTAGVPKVPATLSIDFAQYYCTVGSMTGGVAGLPVSKARRQLHHRA